ncbi:PREDICTED: ankyrin-3-like [Amphimedon queenslandica]|uniref:Death domain-containing protein n=1 Tax=Amphimedon queenslandica TaxID=400682 RepID=A0AAN0IXU8_AMPQE|nr:PREDICTED: ankyrin-3-like [Amphimedon queenslandica]|eukprot:XP_019849590.1 PREDICTED: ankyrin-3-like [Amphimedon queenslandica]
MSELDSKLAVAVTEKRIFDVAKALRDGASPDAVYKGKGMIHIAAEKNYYVILKLLILHNVSLEKTMSTDTEDDLTALHVAVIHDHRDIVCLLTKAGADLNKETKNGQTPLDIAREKDHCVHHLENIENLHGEKGIIVTHCAISLQFNNVASGKVPYGISDIDITLFRDSDQKTLVHIAAEKGLNGSYFDQFLLEDETMLCLKDKNEWTPLHLAASNGHVNTVRFLLRTGAELSPSVIEIAHESVVPYLKNHATELLKEAAFDLNLDGVKQALANGANGSPCLLEAVSEHNRAVTSLLIEAGVDPNQVDKSFLMSQAMKSLLDKVDSSILNKNGKTALDLALARRSTDAVLVFLEAGWRDYDNEKFQILALHYASKQGLMNDVSILISKGVPVNVKDKFDKTALHLSCERGHSDVANALIKAKADVNCQDKSGKTPVHYAAENGHKNIIKILIDNGCDLNIKDKTGRMPMNSCYANDWTEALQLIQTSGGEFNYDMLILDSAAKNDVEMFELALSKTSDINCKNIVSIKYLYA